MSYESLMFRGLDNFNVFDYSPEQLNELRNSVENDYKEPLLVKGISSAGIENPYGVSDTAWKLIFRGAITDTYYGEITDKNNSFIAGLSSADKEPLKIIIQSNKDILNIQKGSILRIKDDEDIITDIYLPHIRQDIILFVGIDGSTYLDKDLYKRVQNNTGIPGTISLINRNLLRNSKLTSEDLIVIPEWEFINNVSVCTSTFLSSPNSVNLSANGDNRLVQTLNFNSASFLNKLEEAGRKITFSFYLTPAHNAIVTYYAVYIKYNNVEQIQIMGGELPSYIIGWQRFIGTFTFPILPSIINKVEIKVTSGVNNTNDYIDDLQLELGETATAFEAT